MQGYNYVNNTQIIDNLSTGNLNLTEIPGFTYTNDYTSGQTLVWNLSGRIYLAPGQQAAIKYRVRVIPGINDTAIDTVFLSYPDTQGVCGDCYFEINTTRAIYPACSVKPDFTVKNLTLPEAVIEGGSVTIFALIRNLQNINLNLSEVNVSLFVDGNLTDSKILNLTNISEINVTFNWVAVFGVHSISVAIDPNNEVDENDELNNEMCGAVNADLLVTKTASKSNVSCYEYVDYTIVIRNILSQL